MHESDAPACLLEFEQLCVTAYTFKGESYLFKKKKEKKQIQESFKHNHTGTVSKSIAKLFCLS